MKKNPKTYVFYLGVIIFGAGLVLKHLFSEVTGAMQALPFVLTGFGAGLIGVGVASIFRKKMLENNPDKAKQYEINEKVERNIRLREKASYTTWYVTISALAILSLIFVVLNNYVACWFALGSLLLHIISLSIYIYIYDKKM